MGILCDKLLADHEQLDRLLSEALDSSGALNEASFEAFRKGLLRHIGIEEKLLFPAARKAGIAALPAFAQARHDHSQLVALLVPIPTAELIERIRALLVPHNCIEEETDGLYDRCERAIGDGAVELAGRIDNAPPVPVRPYRDVRT